MFESLMRLTELYEESQARLRDSTEGLDIVKRYLNEVFDEVKKLTENRLCRKHIIQSKLCDSIMPIFY